MYYKDVHPKHNINQRHPNKCFKYINRVKQILVQIYCGNTVPPFKNDDTVLYLLLLMEKMFFIYRSMKTAWSTVDSTILFKY